MIDPIDELKIRAEILHKRITAGDAASRARLRVLAELAKADDEALAAATATVQRKHCLVVVAREAGFSTWNQALAVLRGDSSERDFGTLLYDAEACRGMLNAWFVDHDEARAHLSERRGRGERLFLLAYKRQFVVVDGHFVEALGFDASDPDWQTLQHDWLSPELPARKRLYAKRLYAKRLAALERRS